MLKIPHQQTLTALTKYFFILYIIYTYKFVKQSNNNNIVMKKLVEALEQNGNKIS